MIDYKSQALRLKKRKLDFMTDNELLNLKTGSIMYFDVECYKNFFYVLFKSAENGKYLPFEQSPSCELNCEKLAWVLYKFCLVGFNSRSYDILIITLALKGASCELLKEATNFIIQNQATVFNFEKRFKVKISTAYNHIDLIELAPLKGSLKLYGGRLHFPTIQDLPIPEDSELTLEEAEIVRVYCGNDLDATEALCIKLAPEIQLRVDMSQKYSVDLRSKSDAQIAETVLKSELEKITGQPVRRPIFQKGCTITYNAPDFIKFKSSKLQSVFEIVKNLEFSINENGYPVEPAEWWQSGKLKKLTVTIGNSTYNLGMGGLHSMEKECSYRADENTIIADNDVASYYPNIILNQNLYPEHLGDSFLDVYRTIVETRIDAKSKAKTSDTEEERAKYKVIADSLKITINGSFGKFGSKYSVLYSPQLLLQVTITGQLCLLMLIEMLEHEGITVVSGNTDGIVSVYPKERHGDVRGIIKLWEQKTNFTTEETRYTGLFSRDVNSYIALKDDGFKTKGGFSGIKSSLSKNPTNSICLEAVVEYLKNKTPIEQTIKQCEDIRKFVTVRNVKGGAHKNNVFLGKVVRWYYAKGESGTIDYIISGNKVPKSDGARPLMDLPNSIPRYIDYDWYINEAISLLYDCNGLQRSKQLTFF